MKLKAVAATGAVLTLAAVCFAASMVQASAQKNQYAVQVQWGKASTPWQDQGTWVIGSRTDKRPIELKLKSGDGTKHHDGGKTFAGQVMYDQKKEGVLAVRGRRINDNTYSIETKKGLNGWKKEGTWVIGGRKNQGVIKLEAKSTDGGKTLTGKLTYAGEGPISFKAKLKP